MELIHKFVSADPLRYQQHSGLTLTQCGLVTPYHDRSWSILAWVKAYCLTVLIQQIVLKPLICIMSLKIMLLKLLTHWGRVMHICLTKLTIISPDNGLSPGWRQAIIWINAGILLIGPLGTSFSEILFEVHTVSFKKIHLKMSSGEWRPFCLGHKVLTHLSGVSELIHMDQWYQWHQCNVCQCPWTHNTEFLPKD